MIAIDSSAVVASVMREADEERYIVAVRAEGRCLLSAANYLECAMVLTRLADGRQELDDGSTILQSKLSRLISRKPASQPMRSRAMDGGNIRLD